LITWLALRPHTAGRLVLVFGAGGDRDRGKRPLMGMVAARLADIAIVTDDNPRSEDPASIRAAVLAACPGGREIGERARAIEAALNLLRPGDVLAIAGKGHEQGQIIGTTLVPFDDVSVVSGLVSAMPSSRPTGPSADERQAVAAGDNDTSAGDTARGNAPSSRHRRADGNDGSARDSGPPKTGETPS